MSMYEAVEREGSAVFLGRFYTKKLVHACVQPHARDYNYIRPHSAAMLLNTNEYEKQLNKMK